MKKIITLIVLLLIITITVVIVAKARIQNSQKNEQVPSIKPPQITVAPSESATEPTQTPHVLENADGTQVKWIILRDISRLKLYSNLEEKLPSYEAKDKYLCHDLTSAGFYGTDGKHIGLFITDGNIVSDVIESSLFNGFFYVANNRPFISSNVPADARIAIQAGPLLIKKEKYLEIIGDEPARRIVLATNRQDQIMFIAIYDGANTVSGPRLRELPGVLKNIDKNTSLDFLDAINLDGGAHSAFLTNEFKITELSTIGSYFCF